MPLPDSSLPFREWYELLQKPAWTPAVATIGTVWSLLYPLMLGCSVWILVQVAKGEWSRNLLLPLGVLWACNLLFTPVQFGLRNFALASFLVVATCCAGIWLLATLWPESKLLSFLVVPYIAWTATASVLQISLTWMNR